MKLLYLKEHLSCINYQVAYNTGFVFCELRKKKIVALTTNLLFV